MGSDITICSGKNNSDDGEIKILTGLDDVSKLGTIVTYDQKTEQDYWSSSEDTDAQECNSIRGSDGSLFPPFVSKNQTLYIYNKAMCRSLALEFSVSMGGEDKDRGVLLTSLVPGNCHPPRTGDLQVRPQQEILHLG